MAKDFSFFIYDYESFGVNPAIDRPAQFAGIRTDADFNIIGEPIMFYCKQTNDYLPAPEAVMVTGITPQECNEKGFSEPEFAARILTEFSQPDTCVMGYNNIRYDDEMTRYTFYRNFIDPYEYSWKNGNSRWDLLDLVRACYALRPEGINWAYDDDGMPSFRLEKLTKANGIEHENAHDAMADVYATIAMAKLIKEKQPKLFQYFFENRGKKEIEKLVDTGAMAPLVHVSGMLGNYRGNCTWVAPLAWHPTNQNALIVCDLTGDIDNLLAKSADELRANLYTKKSELEERSVPPVPLKLVHINKCPLRSLPAEKLSEHGLAFEDKRIPELLFHYRARHFYKTLTRAEQIKWQKYRQNKLEKSAVDFESSLQRLAEKHSDNPEKLSLLQQVYEYGIKLLG